MLEREREIVKKERERGGEREREREKEREREDYRELSHKSFENSWWTSVKVCFWTQMPQNIPFRKAILRL